MVAVAIIGAFASAFSALMSMITASMVRGTHAKLDRSAEKADAIENKLDDVRNEVNGKMEQLVNTTGLEQRALGKLEGKAEERADKKLKP